MGSVGDVYERLVRLYNAGDLGSLVNSYTEEATLVSPDGAARGRAAIFQQWNRDKAAFPDRSLTINMIIEQGDTVASEFTWAATNTGPLVQPDGTELPPTGKRIETRGMELVRVREGKVAAHRVYWDAMALAGQLGLLPGREARLVAQLRGLPPRRSETDTGRPGATEAERRCPASGSGCPALATGAG